ncbi:MAG: repeat domain protein [Actinomycetia bacterium]|nr:repeat domain protein [Actinomycetes bacterium]
MTVSPALAGVPMPLVAERVNRYSDGTAVAWGYNGAGELGDGTTTDRATPVLVSGLTGVTQISAGLGHSLPLHADHPHPAHDKHDAPVDV